METPNLTILLEEVVRLQKRSDLLDFLLSRYNSETKTFDIPAKWKNSNVRADKLPAKTPRNHVLKEILKTLTEEELIEVGIYDHESIYNL